jgi:hypothetical protein
MLAEVASSELELTVEWLTCYSTIKISILAFYRRFMPRGAYHVFLYACAAAMAMLAISVSLVSLNLYILFITRSNSENMESGTVLGFASNQSVGVCGENVEK